MVRKILFVTVTILISFSGYGQDTLPVAKFLGSGKAYATMFFEYYYMLEGDEAYPGKAQYSKNIADDNAFSFRRVYLGYVHTFSDKFSGKVQLEGFDNSTLNDEKRAMFIKEANFVWKNIYPLADLYIGHSLTPVWSIEGAESYWMYRSIEATIADARGMRSSNDSGLRIKGRFNRKKTLGYNLMVGNGNSTKAENDKYKLFYTNLWTKMFDNRLYVEIYQDFNKSDNNRSIATTKGFVAWQTKNYTIAAEAVNQMKKRYSKDDSQITIQGFSLFAHATLVQSRLRAFGRFDTYNPDAHFSDSHYATNDLKPYNEKFFTFGMDYTPLKDIHIMPNIWVNTYNNKIEGQTTPKNEVVARLTFNVTFK